MEVILIRHFQTEGNRLRRYIGVTDESLCEDAYGKDCSGYHKAERVIVSPMKRCIQTCELIYKGLFPIVCEGLRECDFGRFENKNYTELAGDPFYQQWIDSNGKLPFPEGESIEQFKGRTLQAYEECLNKARNEGISSLAFVVHGGTIMAVAEAVSGKSGSYYDWQVKNGEGIVIHYDGSYVRSIERIAGIQEMRS